jgi:hypothetical protein
VFLYLEGLGTIYALNSMVSTTDNAAIVDMLYTCEDFREITFEQVEVPNDGHSFFASAFLNPIVQAEVKAWISKEVVESADDKRMLYIDQLRKMVADKIDTLDAHSLQNFGSKEALVSAIRWKKTSVADLEKAEIPSEDDFYRIESEDKLNQIAGKLQIIRSNKSLTFQRWKKQIANVIGFQVPKESQCEQTIYWKFISEIFDVPVHIMQILDPVTATIKQTIYYEVHRRLPLAQHLFVLSIDEGSESKYQIHYNALKVVAQPPQQVSELAILDRWVDIIENVFYEDTITLDFVKYCFLQWYVGGDYDLYCKKCRIDGPEQKTAETAKLHDMFKQNGDPCQILFDSLSGLEKLENRTKNKFNIMKLLQSATQIFFEKLGKTGRDAYTQKLVAGQSVKDVRICVEFDYFVITLLLSMSDTMKQRYRIAAYKGKKNNIIGLTANGHNLTANLFTYPVNSSFNILFDDRRLAEYCNAVMRNNVISARNFGTKFGRQGGDVNFQQKLNEGNRQHDQEREEAKLQEASRARKIAEELAQFTTSNEKEVQKLWENAFFNRDQGKTWASFLSFTKLMEKRTQYLCVESCIVGQSFRDIDQKTIVRDPVTLITGENCPDYRQTLGITKTNIFLAICQFPADGFYWGKTQDCLTDEDKTMLLASASDEKQTRLIKRNAYAKKLKEECKNSFQIYYSETQQYQNVLKKSKPEDFLQAIKDDTVLKKHMALLMWLISWILKKKICIYEISYNDHGMTQEQENVKELFFIDRALYGDNSGKAKEKVSQLGEIKLLYDPKRHYFDQAHVQTSEEKAKDIGVSEKSDPDVQWQTLPVPANDLEQQTVPVDDVSDSRQETVPAVIPAHTAPNAWSGRNRLIQHNRKTFKFSQSSEMKYLQQQNIPPDGNCLFLSIATGLAPLFMNSETVAFPVDLQNQVDIIAAAQQLRDGVSTYILTHTAEFVDVLPVLIKEELHIEDRTPQYYQDEHGKDLEPIDLLTKYATSIRTDIKFWGNHFCITIIAKLYLTPIIVLNTRKNPASWDIDKQANVQAMEKICNIKDINYPAVYVLFNGKDHYDAVEFIEEQIFSAHADQQVPSVKEAHVSSLQTFQWLVEEVMYYFYRYMKPGNNALREQSKRELLKSLALWWYDQSVILEVLDRLAQIFPPESQTRLFDAMQLRLHNINWIQSPLKQFWIALKQVLIDTTTEWAINAVLRKDIYFRRWCTKIIGNYTLTPTVISLSVHSELLGGIRDASETVKTVTEKTVEVLLCNDQSRKDIIDRAESKLRSNLNEVLKQEQLLEEQRSELLPTDDLNELVEEPRSELLPTDDYAMNTSQQFTVRCMHEDCHSLFRAVALSMNGQNSDFFAQPDTWVTDSSINELRDVAATFLMLQAMSPQYQQGKNHLINLSHATRTYVGIGNPSTLSWGNIWSILALAEFIKRPIVVLYVRNLYALDDGEVLEQLTHASMLIVVLYLPTAHALHLLPSKPGWQTQSSDLLDPAARVV